MTSGWTDGYVSDITYTYGYYQELSPVIQHFALLLRGLRAPDVNRPFRSLELGFGQGVSLNLLAAAYPQGEFWGIDFNPSHAAYARRLAENAGSQNVHISDQSFAEFLEADTPPFDFISLHGVYSWVSEENRATIVEILRRKLKVGGVVYISYNALPGWAAAMPLRQFMIEHAQTTAGNTRGKIERSLEFLAKMNEVKAGYFAANPLMPGRLDGLKKMSPSYLAHEYFNRDWTPFYFSQVQKDMEAAKLTFGSYAHLGDHVDVLNVSPQAQALLNTLPDMVGLRETARDYCTNTQFRRDLFVRGELRMSEQEQRDALLATRFVLMIAPEKMEYTIKAVAGEITLNQEIYQPLIEALHKGPATLKQLMAEKTLSSLSFPQLLQAIVVLIAQRKAMPCLPEEGEALRQKSATRFNHAVMEMARVSDTVQNFASPLLGGGVQQSRVEQLYLLATESKVADKLDDVGAFVWEIISTQGQRMMKDGKVMETPEENIARLNELYREYLASSLPLLRSLKITGR
jgi:SAM-dependent methyltransferase